MTTEKRLLQRLRLQMTAIYAIAALAFIGLIGGWAYGLIGFYSQRTADLVLRSRMAAAFAQLGRPLPEELRQANLEWLRLSDRAHDDREHEPEEGHEREEEDDEDKKERNAPPAASSPLEALGGTFLVWLDENARYRLAPDAIPAGFTPSLEAIQAIRAGRSYDLRTVYTSNGEPIRLLTYPVLGSDGARLYLQVGRSILEQDAVLRQLLLGLLIAGGAMVLIAAPVSWLIAGRAIRPVQAAWDRQREFIANASHELRAPLTLIQLSADIALREDTPSEERQALLASITQETRHMNALIGDLLTLSRADAGRLPLDIKPMPLGALLAELGEAWARACVERGLTLRVEPTDAAVLADVTHLRQALVALLDNAVRHTPAGGQITLRAAPSGRRVLISVADTGEGIPPQHLPHVFERFYQADAAHSRKGSSGLGLSIVKALIEAMRGEVSITSQVGAGTTVTLALPAAP